MLITNMLNRTTLFALLTGFLIALLTACSDPETVVEHKPVPIESGDTCHLCGMIIKNHPGPKGELYAKGSEVVKRFCSTRDLFAWVLQPENQPNIDAIFVHDMAVSPWNTPDDEAFINARDAWYVAGSSQAGAMGTTLASFAEQAAADKFAQDFGGKVIRFDDITLQVLNDQPAGMMHNMDMKDMHHSESGHKHHEHMTMDASGSDS
ncbi:nitrous oxide reductase accessory protein NosL [Spongorhabdus nitratireducens]